MVTIFEIASLRLRGSAPYSPTSTVSVTSRHVSPRPHQGHRTADLAKQRHLVGDHDREEILDQAARCRPAPSGSDAASAARCTGLDRPEGHESRCGGRAWVGLLLATARPLRRGGRRRGRSSRRGRGCGSGSCHRRRSLRARRWGRWNRRSARRRGR